jgi:hypothetical protein
MHLVSEVLDNQLVDRNTQRMGRADGIVAVLHQGQPLRLAYIESGPLTQAGRVHPRLARWLAVLVARLGIRRMESFRIPWSHVLDVGLDIDVDVDVEHMPAFAVEHWLRQHIIGRMPGA